MTQPEIVVDLGSLRDAIIEEYKAVAQGPQQGFHFHTGRRLTQLVGYSDELLEGIPEGSIAAFAGTGNPFSLGRITLGENVVDVGSGAGIDSLVAARMTGPAGKVVGVDMTAEMQERARNAAAEAGLGNVEFKDGYAESLPVPDEWADVVISNGVLNLVPDKSAALAAMYRALKPGVRLQIGDNLVQVQVPEEAKLEIDLWTG